MHDPARAPSNREGPCALGRRAPHSVCSDRALVSGLLQLACLLATAAPIVLEDEGDPIALVKRADASRFQRRGVDEYILATRFRCDEAVAFCRVKEFHGSGNAHVERSFPGKAWLGRSKQGRTHGPAAQMMWGRQTAPRGLAAKPQILRRAPLWSAPAGRLYGSGLLPTQDTIELPLAFCPRIQQGAVSPTW